MCVSCLRMILFTLQGRLFTDNFYVCFVCLLSQKTGKQLESDIVNPKNRFLWEKCQFSQLRSAHRYALHLGLLSLFSNCRVVQAKLLHKLKPV